MSNLTSANHMQEVQLELVLILFFSAKRWSGLEKYCLESSVSRFQRREIALARRRFPNNFARVKHRAFGAGAPVFPVPRCGIGFYRNHARQAYADAATHVLVHRKFARQIEIRRDFADGLKHRCGTASEQFQFRSSRRKEALTDF